MQTKKLCWQKAGPFDASKNESSCTEMVQPCVGCRHTGRVLLMADVFEFLAWKQDLSSLSSSSSPPPPIRRHHATIERALAFARFKHFRLSVLTPSPSLSSSLSSRLSTDILTGGSMYEIRSERIQHHRHHLSTTYIDSIPIYSFESSLPPSALVVVPKQKRPIFIP